MSVPAVNDPPQVVDVGDHLRLDLDVQRRVVNDATPADVVSRGGQAFPNLAKQRALHQQMLDEGAVPRGDWARDRSATQSYDAYAPAITRGSVVAGASSTWKYNHDASLEYFGDRWFCLWNANTSGIESTPPQYILQATSEDFETWSAPAVAFSDAITSSNPVTVLPSGAQWQPGTGVIGDELWALWFQSGTNGDTYFSVLTDPDGQWTNTALGLLPYTHAGVTYVDGFITGDLVQLESGRVLAPIVLQSNTTTSLPAGLTANGFYERLKLAGVLYTDDGGVTWSIGGLITPAAKPWCVWEPCISIQADGAVRLFVRSLDTTASSDQQMLTALSFDEGLSFTALNPVRADTPSSRATVVNRDLKAVPSLMVMNDNQKVSTVVSTADRRNLAVWVGLGGNDYVPGVGLSSDALDNGPCYPSARVRDGKLYTVFSCYEGSLGYTTDIKTAVVDPAPGYGAVMPRSNASRLASPEFITNPYLAFRYATGMTMKTVATMASASASEFSFGAILSNTRAGGVAVLDCRTLTVADGLLVKVGPNVVVGTINGATYTEYNTGLAVPTNGDEFYLGVSIDGTAQTLDTWVVRKDGTVLTDSHPLGYAPGALNPAQNLYIGCARTGSSVPTLVGRVRLLKTYSAVLTANQHRSIQQANAAAVGMTAWAGSTTAPPSVVVDYDAASSDAGTNNTAWTDVFSRTGAQYGYVEAETVGGVQMYKIVGTGSVGLAPPLSPRNAAHYTFKYTAAAGRSAEVAVLTVGAVDKYFSLVKTSGTTIKARWKDSYLSSDLTVGTSIADAVEYTVNVIVGRGQLTIAHEGCEPVTVEFAGRPLVFVGQAWSPSYVGGTENYIHLNIGSVAAKDAVIAETAYLPTLRTFSAAATGDVVESIQLPGEAFARFVRLGSGKMLWGDGTASPTGSGAALDRRGSDLGTPSTLSFNIGNGAWDGGHLKQGSYHFPVDAHGNLRIQGSTPTTDTSASLVGGPMIALADTDLMRSSQVYGEDYQRWRQLANGELQWGDGSSTVDVFLKRIAAGVLGVVSTHRFRTGASAFFESVAPDGATVNRIWTDNNGRLRTLSADPASRSTGGLIAGERVVVAKSAVAVSHTGDTAKTTVATVTLPGGLVGLNGSVEIITLWSNTGNANNKTVRIELGSTAYMAMVLTTNIGAQGWTSIRAVNSQSSQKGHGPGTTTQFGTTGNAMVTSSLDLSADQTLTFSVQLASAGDTAALESYEVVVTPHA